MAGNAGGIRAGKAYVEIGTNDSALQKGLARAERRLKAFGASVQSLGRGFLAIGAAAATPLAAGVRAFSSYEDALASLRTAANPTAEDLARIETAIADLSRSTGAGPAEVAASMTELLKAGMSVESVLGGAAEAAIQFARVAEMDAAEAATVLADAMNVFGEDATATVDALSRAADASSISVRDVAMSFSMAGAVAKQAGLGIEEAANAIAVLGQNGIKGSDAGTSLKTMLLRLQTGAESAGEIMKMLGINVRDARGQMLPMRGIIAELQAKLSGLNSQARDQAMLKLFGTDAIRAGAILIGEGVAGWDEFNAKMAEGLPVADKYSLLMGTLGGMAQRAWSALQRLGVTAGKELAPALGTVVDWSIRLIDALASWASENPGLVKTVGLVVAGVVGLGTALIVLGLGFSLAGVAAGGLATAVGVAGAVLGAILSPVGLVVAGLAAGAVAFFKFSDAGGMALGWLADRFGALKADALAAFGGIADAMRAGDLGLAAEILWLSIKVQWQQGINLLNALWQDWGTAFKAVFSDVQFWLARSMTDLWASVQSGFVTSIGAIQDGWTMLLAFLKTGANDVGGLFAKVWAYIKSFFDGSDLQEEFEKIDAETAAKNAGVQSQRDGTLFARQGDRQQQLDAIESDRQLALASIDDQQASADEARRRAAADSLAAGDAELARLRGELEAALAEAAAKAVPAEAEGAGGAAAGPGRLTPEGLGASLDRAARKTDVKGTFSAAALRGFGAGDSAADRTADAAEKTAEGIQRLNDRARQGRLVFTS